jgi:hypothetical protein
LKLSFLPLPAVAAVLLAATFSIAQSAPTLVSPQQPGGNPSPPPRVYPAPTNLKVLPKNLTGQQVHEIMEGWEAALGAHCSTCHVADPKNIGPNGRPRLNFADDSKKEKATARLMFKMVEDINTNYVSMVENSGVPVTCGTCHRGNLDPGPWTPPHEEHDHEAPPKADEKPPIPR